ncbi:ATP-binding protein [Azotobacter chroococcum]|uniref:ATP-binding protein n=1 Tax=Azotobacter chroococcum TaxID=353 RepID=A0AAQ0C096_9GAMM|nr:ATP-binding protein [Azotobacter chroococcum]QQE89595.1 ATP-binding protein [Azotobacter chroococcum]
MNAILKPMPNETGRIPMMNTGQALLSLRDSGYDLPTAIGEVLDNSIEARANRIRIRLDQAADARGKKHVHRIAISDDGNGMDLDTLHHYLVIGFSTRYMHKDTIGKYGVGAKFAALNFGRRIDVWSRDTADGAWLHTEFDLENAIKLEQQGQPIGLDVPCAASIPPDLQELLPSGTGTLVVWSRVDRLEEGRLAADFNGLRLELEKELSRIFRSFIEGGIAIEVNDKPLIAFDPLMLMRNAWHDHVLNKYAAKARADQKKKVGKRGVQELQQHYEAELILDEQIKISRSVARLRVTLYPKEVLRKRGMGGDELAKELRLRENQGSLSFMRLNREVSYTNVPRILPDGVQKPDRFIGIEVAFKPDLDDFFGIRNVKRGVEPHGELRIRIRELLEKAISQARKKIDEQWDKVAREEHENDGEHAAVTAAVKDVDLLMPKGRVEDTATPEQVEEVLEDLANDLGYDKEEDRREYLERIRELPFILETVSFPGSTFIHTQHVGGQVIIRLNKRHPFYRDMWTPIRELAEREPGAVSGEEATRAARRALEALQLLVIAYGKAESMDLNPSRYDDLTMYWGQFLATLMNKVKDIR